MSSPGLEILILSETHAKLGLTLALCVYAEDQIQPRNHEPHLARRTDHGLP